MAKAGAWSDQDRSEFVRSLERMLRHGEAEQALMQARRSLDSLRDADPSLVQLAQSTEPHDLVITGWATLESLLDKYDSRYPVTAISLDLSWPGHFAASPNPSAFGYDKRGGLAPVLEIGYFYDREDIGFATADRETLIDAYTDSGPPWRGEFDHIGNDMEIAGMDALYGAVQRARTQGQAPAQHKDAYTLAACIAAILVHLAVKRMIETEGLPRPIAVFVGSNEDFPCFDAPVVSSDEASQWVRLYKSRGPQQNGGRERRKDQHKAGEKVEFDPVRGFAEIADAAQEFGKLFGKASRDFRSLSRDDKAQIVAGSLGVAFVIAALTRQK